MLFYYKKIPTLSGRDFFPLFGGSIDHDLLHFHVVALDEAEHVDTVGGLEIQVVCAFNLSAAHDATGDVHHLKDGLAVVADDPAAVAIERERVIVVGIAANEHQLEA